MKTKFLFGLALVGMILFGCSYDDDGSYVSLEIRDALTFENNQNYVVGDTIYFELIFSRYLDEEGFSNKLDVFESSGSDSFYYNFDVNKFSELSDGFRRIDIAQEFIFAEKGSIGEFGGNTAKAELNDAKIQYESRIGLILAEEGRFELDLTFLYIRSDNYAEDRVRIDIRHVFATDPPNFEFMVSAE